MSWSNLMDKLKYNDNKTTITRTIIAMILRIFLFFLFIVGIMLKVTINSELEKFVRVPFSSFLQSTKQYSTFQRSSEEGTIRFSLLRLLCFL